MIKPSGPNDLMNTELRRKESKRRDHRRDIEFKDDDRFDGLDKDVKNLLKYSSKTMS